MQRERDLLAARVASLEAELAEQAQDAGDLEADLIQVREELADTEQSLAEVEEALESAELNLVGAEQDLGAAVAENERLTAVGAALARAVDRAEAELALATAQPPAPEPTQAPSPAPSPEPAPTPTSPPPPTVSAPPLADLVDPSSRIFGLYTQQAPFNWATYDETSFRVGYRPNVVGFFAGWDEDFRASGIQRAWERQTIPIMTWESRPISSPNSVTNEPEYSLPTILAGDHDEYLRQWARDVVELGLPFGLRFNHEMNGTWYPWSEITSSGAPINGNNRGDYVRAWRYVHDLFTEEGANEFIFWIWAPNIVNNLATGWNNPERLDHRTLEFTRSYYPGDEYVDWVGLSGYLRPPYTGLQAFDAANPGSREDYLFDFTFAESLEQLRQITDKPILLAEVAASETATPTTGPNGAKPQWITSLFNGLAREENADILGFMWFNLTVTSYSGNNRTTNDWRITSRADSLQAFHAGIRRPDLGFDLRPHES